MSRVPPLKSTHQPVKSITKLFTTLFTDSNYTDLPGNWERVYGKMNTLQERLDTRENSPASNIYKFRMFDILLDRTTQKPNLDLWENIFNLKSVLNGKESNLNILSPRIMPVMPSNKGRNGMLSPALFPLYQDEKESQILSIPKVLGDWGLSESDRNAVLQMIMEITGTRQTVEDAINVLENFNSCGVGDAIFKATGELKKTFTKLRHSFDLTQRKSFKKDGFAILDSEQLKRLHDEVGMTGKQKEIDYEVYGNLDRKQRRSALWNVVERIAYKPKRRQKRDIKILTFLAPVVLAPYMFSPVYGISILGPIVLSPNIFSPLILNPSVLGPWVLSPAVPLPFILSPYLLSPYVLSPLVMAPFILSPYVISPNVINPYVLAPVILSPVVLCPDVMSPMVLGGPILSPGVLSPSVLSKSVLMANVLSPTVLS